MSSPQPISLAHVLCLGNFVITKYAVGLHFSVADCLEGP